MNAPHDTSEDRRPMADDPGIAPLDFCHSRRKLLKSAGAGVVSIPILTGTVAAAGQTREPIGEFSGNSTGGFVGFARESREEAKTDGTTIPAGDDTDEAFHIDGVLYDDGTWESPEPVLPPLDTGVTTVQADLPNGLHGVFDLENELMTAAGTVLVTGRDGSTIEFDVEVTTEESGDLTGTFELSGDLLSITLVDNEFIVDDTTGVEVIDEDLGLPATDPGENYIEIGFELEPDEELVAALLGVDSADSGDGTGDGTDESGDETDGPGDGADETNEGTDEGGNADDTSADADDDGVGFGIAPTLGGVAGVGYFLIRHFDRKTANRRRSE